MNYLYGLKDSGFEPKVVYDIGSHVLRWTSFARTLWPEAKFILFDAWDKAELLYQESNAQYFIGVLGREDGKQVNFYQSDQEPGGNSYYREIGHPTAHKIFPDDSCVVRETPRLDSVVVERSLPLPDLVKIDVQGAEWDVINGGAKTINAAKWLIVEMQHVQYNQGAPLAKETIPCIEALGWKCVAPLFTNNGPDGDYAFLRYKKMWL